MVEVISRIAAPVGAVTTPILDGILGIFFLCIESNNPSSFSLQYINFPLHLQASHQHKSDKHHSLHKH